MLLWLPLLLCIQSIVECFDCWQWWHPTQGDAVSPFLRPAAHFTPNAPSVQIHLVFSCYIRVYWLRHTVPCVLCHSGRQYCARSQGWRGSWPLLTSVQTSHTQTLLIDSKMFQMSFMFLFEILTKLWYKLYLCISVLELKCQIFVYNVTNNIT